VKKIELKYYELVLNILRATKFVTSVLESTIRSK